MSTDIDQIEDHISQLESEIAEKKAEIERLTADIERKSRIIETLRPAIRTIRDFVEGRETPRPETPTSESVVPNRLRELRSAKEDSEGEETHIKRRPDTGDTAKQILLEAKGSWLSFHDVAKIAAKKDPKLKKLGVRQLAALFNEAMKNRKDFEHQGTFYRINQDQ